MNNPKTIALKGRSMREHVAVELVEGQESDPTEFRWKYGRATFFERNNAYYDD